MASQVQICNLALSHIGITTPISSIDEAGAEARQCKLHYDQAVTALIGGPNFIFQNTVSVVAMAQVTNDWDSRWLYAFARPVGTIKICRVVPEIDYAEDAIPVPYGVRGDNIYCDIEVAYLERVTSPENPEKFGPLLVDAISAGLAARIAYPLTRDASVQRAAMETAQRMRMAAEAGDANENYNRRQRTAGWHTARD